MPGSVLNVGLSFPVSSWLPPFLRVSPFLLIASPSHRLLSIVLWQEVELKPRTQILNLISRMTLRRFMVRPALQSEAGDRSGVRSPKATVCQLPGALICLFRG